MFIGRVAEQPVAQAADGEVADRGKRLLIVGVDDQPGDFIAFIRNQCFLQEVLERDICQRHLRRHTFAVILRGDTGEEVPGA